LLLWNILAPAAKNTSRRLPGIGSTVDEVLSRITEARRIEIYLPDFRRRSTTAARCFVESSWKMIRGKEKAR
jgi:hypothetical protein